MPHNPKAYRLVVACDKVNIKVRRSIRLVAVMFSSSFRNLLADDKENLCCNPSLSR